jgi:hypothetical protein
LQLKEVFALSKKEYSMVRFIRLTCGLGLAASLALPACGSGAGVDPSNSASAFSSGLPKDQSFANVTDADIGALCKAWADYVIGPQRDVFCDSRVWSAATAALTSSEAMGCGPDAPCTEFTDADAQKACAEAETKCHRPASVDEVVTFCDFQKPSPGCTATVSEFEACVAEFFVIMDESFSGYSCSTLTVAELRTSAGRPPSSPAGNYTACKTFNDKCPGAFAGTAVSPDCGNGMLDPGEQCDGTDLDGETCASVTGGSLPNGELVCNRACMFDGSVCTGP